MAKITTQNGTVHYLEGPGFVKYFAGDIPPEGYLLCNGAEISKAAYPELYAAIGDIWGTPENADCFLLPPANVNFPRGADGSALPVGTVQEDAIRNISGDLSFRTLGENLIVYGKDGAFMDSGYTHQATSGTVSGLHNIQTINFSAANVVPTADENRPKSLVLLPCIKY